MVSEELKPCPFCGKLLIRYEVVDVGDIIFVRYHHPETNGETLCVFEMVTDDFYRYQIEGWNTRPIEDQLKAEIERLQARVQELEQERRWIPVSEKLPEKEQEVLVSYGDGNWVTSAYLYFNTWYDIPYDSPIKPTHWQPLPQPPQEQK